MRVLTFTLVADGTSDRALIPVIEWLLTAKLHDVPFVVQMAEGLPPFRDGLEARIRYAHTMYPCDALIVHRDSEAESWENRLNEVSVAVVDPAISAWIPVIPVRMTEAWLLAHEGSIRRAAGRPLDQVPLSLPRRNRWEHEPDPKSVLFSALKTASGLTGRRLQKFNVHAARARLVTLIDDFGYLRGLACFDDFERRLNEFLYEFNV